jgi:hypothetical protein
MESCDGWYIVGPLRAIAPCFLPLSSLILAMGYRRKSYGKPYPKSSKWKGKPVSKKPFGDLPHYQWEVFRSKTQSVTLGTSVPNWFTYSMPLLVPDVSWLSGVKLNVQITSSSGVPYSVTTFVVAAPEGGEVVKEGLISGCPSFVVPALDGHSPSVERGDVERLSQSSMIVQGSVGKDHVAIAYRKWYTKVNSWHGLSKKGKTMKKKVYYVVVVVQGHAVHRVEGRMGIVLKGTWWCRSERPQEDMGDGDAVME